MHHYVENQKKMQQRASSGAGRAETSPQRVAVAAGGSKPKQLSLEPCTVRCPGMSGVIPQLQCIRCLCLFHHECLGLPPNLMFNKYLCTVNKAFVKLCIIMHFRTKLDGEFYIFIAEMHRTRSYSRENGWNTSKADDDAKTE